MCHVEDLSFLDEVLAGGPVCAASGAKEKPPGVPTGVIAENHVDYFGAEEGC